MGDGIACLTVIGHGNKTVALTAVSVRVSGRAHLLDRSERGEQLPQCALCGIKADVVDEDGVNPLRSRPIQSEIILNMKKTGTLKQTLLKNTTFVKYTSDCASNK